MFFDQHHLAHHKARQAELEQQVQRQQLVRSALKGERGMVRFYAPLLLSIGNQMVNVGTQLQQRYSERQRQLHNSTALKSA